MLCRFIAFARTCRNDRRGTALVEFAVAAPFMLLLYFGAYTFSDATACNRKVTITARALTDLTSRYTSLTSADVTTILNAGAQVLSPYDAAKSQIVLSEIKVSATTSSATVIWSRARNGTALTTGSTVTIPANLASTGNYLILGQVQYAYTPVAWLGSMSTINLSDTIYMFPRVTDQVPLS